MGLDLSTPAGIQATAIDIIAHQSQTGEHASEPDRSPLRFGRSMPLFDPGHPGNSYVLYKLLVSADYAATEAAPELAEIDRLHTAIITGMPMPPFAGYAPPLGGMEALSQWIAAGAPVSSCP